MKASSHWPYSHFWYSNFKNLAFAANISRDSQLRKEERKEWRNKWLNISEFVCDCVCVCVDKYSSVRHHSQRQYNMLCFLIHNVLPEQFTFAPHKQTICANQWVTNNEKKKKKEETQTGKKSRQQQEVDTGRIVGMNGQTFNGTKNRQRERRRRRGRKKNIYK